MERIPLTLGRAAGLLGIIICLVSAGVRAAGSYWVAGVPASSLFNLGIASMVAGCFFLLLVATSRPRRG
ncbi:MAG: hypothetical protein ACKVQA_11690 [Burkholderiales bacterium]